MILRYTTLARPLRLLRLQRMTLPVVPGTRAALGAHVTRRPVQIRPDGSSLPVGPSIVALAIHAVTASLEEGLQVLHHWPTFKVSTVWILEGPPARPEVYQHLKRFVHQAIGHSIISGTVRQDSGILSAWRAEVNVIKMPWRILPVIKFQDVNAVRRRVFNGNVKRDDMPARSLKNLANTPSSFENFQHAHVFETRSDKRIHPTERENWTKKCGVRSQRLEFGRPKS